MNIYSTKRKWQNALEPIVNLCVSYHVHPDVFTYIALVLSVIASVSLLNANQNPMWLALVSLCVLTRLLLNLMDGLVARAMGLANAWGEVKNEFGDRIADAMIFVALGLSGYADVRLALMAVSLILCVSYLGILGKAVNGSRVYGGIFGKGDRMITLAAFTVFIVITENLTAYNWYLAYAVVAASITIAQRLRIIYRESR
jgi:CDP-diacylglycerol--glycerol-3-phosphate 3-phosphatidyltransferase